MAMTKLEAARRAQRWTQTRLGWKARLSQSQVSAIEHKRLVPGPEQSKRLAKALGLKADELTQDSA
jgi:ribosome-binding protein aMBF1 (putative translation factor)